MERKKKRDQAKARRRVPPPFISVKDTINETTVVVPDIKVFKRPDVRPRHVCAITGRPARYRDPITGLPYSTPFAFKIIRDKYEKFLMTTVTDTPEVKKYLDLFEWEDEEEDVQEERENLPFSASEGLVVRRLYAALLFYVAARRCLACQQFVQVLLAVSEEECPSGSRASTFRHIFGQTPQRSEWFDWGAGLGSAVAANPKFLAIAIDGGAGGQIVVSHLI
ncbi:unnamed protein product [Heligmosomoides polygyrus]|uniref:Uncharacterized protein n=1 Tax=Heligmosomoides polygyrus TaxID=6339 RepID=A0A3P8ANN7_HELPZ|nr:unnamed protein product [Heligmosomoides polygyrus]